MTSAPIGIFDSGLGGISVLKEIRALLPYEDLIYVADSGFCPYGGRPVDEIIARAATITERLLELGARLIVVACNTATIAAVEWLRSTYTVPFIGMEPAIKPAVAATKTGTVGVLATGAALAGERFHRLVERHAGDVRVITQPCPGFVEQVERGDLDGPLTRDLVEAYTRPLVAAGADTLVLGCTHYPFLRPLIADIVGPAVQLIDTGAAVARQTQRVLVREGMPRQGPETGSIRWLTSGDPRAVAPVMGRLWGAPVMVEPLGP